MEKHLKSTNIGKFGENVAKKYLVNKGLKYLKSNYHSKYGEIDIIFEDDKYIIFVEVKTRKEGALVRGVDSVNNFKKVKILKTALVYISEFNPQKQPRFDVLEVIINRKGECFKINHFQNAFDMEELDAFF